jgi:acetate kinase/phosphoesterase RecJ-like protein
MIDFNALNRAIEEADSIVLFHHINPDCDALGSQFGLKSWLNENYPDKKVYACGTMTSSQGEWPACDEYDEEIIRSSIAIVLDTATAVRADDQRFMQAEKIVRVDHHPVTDPYGDLVLVNPKAAATCEILSAYFRFSGKNVSVKTAGFLYKGLLTDTLRFSTNNTTADTLREAAWLAEKGIDIPALNRELFDLTMDEFRLTSLIRSKVTIEECGFAWLIMSGNELQEYGVSGSEARGHIDEIGHVKDFKVWAMFTERNTEDGIVFDGSLRSKKAAVNTIAAQYGGGGHKNAAGVKGLSYRQLQEILSLLRKAADE